MTDDRRPPLACAAAQLPLALDHPPAYGRADFLVGACNRDALAWIELWPAWPGGTLVLCGPAGSGKTHLAHVWAARAGAATVQARGIDPEAVGGAHLAIEAVDEADDDARLLHAVNRAVEAGCHVLATARVPPGRWRSRLADLASRLRAAQTAALGRPDDELIAAVLEKQIRDRRLAASDGVVAYLLRRMERSFEAAGRVVAEADALALAERRRVTIPLVRRILARQEASRARPP